MAAKAKLAKASQVKVDAVVRFAIIINIIEENNRYRLVHLGRIDHD